MLPLQRFILWLMAMVAVLLSLPAAADPPARVGRLSLAEGLVTLRIDRRDPGSPATANWPISSGVILETGEAGRVEVQVGSSAFRLASDSSMEVAVIDDGHIVLQLERGSLAFTVRDRDQADDIEVKTASGQIQVAGAGHYRIDMEGDNGGIQVSSWGGSAYIYRPDGQWAVPAGRRGMIYGDGGWILADLQRDRFDDWNAILDADSDATQARRHVSPEMTGYEDLDAYGDWSSTTDYGPVWFPRAVPLDWAPYRYGRWAWVQPWGWTWVDAAPWGFAPFHYGRWLFIGGRWAWVPGIQTARPVYAPALVAWIGSPGWSVNFNFGPAPAVGWFPLAPQEVFVPAYRCSPAYLRQLNINHLPDAAVINRLGGSPRARRHFAHDNLVRAATVVPADAVRNGISIAPVTLSRHDRHDLARAPVAARAPSAWLRPAVTALRPRPGSTGAPRIAPPGSSQKAAIPSQVVPAVPQPPLGASPPLLQTRPPQGVPVPPASAREHGSRAFSGPRQILRRLPGNDTTPGQRTLGGPGTDRPPPAVAPAGALPGLPGAGSVRHEATTGSRRPAPGTLPARQAGIDAATALRQPPSPLHPAPGGVPGRAPPPAGHTAPGREIRPTEIPRFIDRPALQRPSAGPAPLPPAPASPLPARPSAMQQAIPHPPPATPGQGRSAQVRSQEHGKQPAAQR